jgi:outer membrane PBP1 activator LpoA protein
MLATVLFAGCATTSLPPSTVDTGGPEREARELAAAGNVTAAVAIYTDLHARAIGPERARWALEVAELLVDSGDGDGARTWLQRAEADGSSSQTSRLIALNASLSLLEGNAAEALAWLDRITSDVEQSLALRILATRGQALFGLGRVEEAVRVLVERDIWLGSDAEVLANHEAIWDGLRRQALTGRCERR